MAKKIRLISFWMEEEEKTEDVMKPANVWMKKNKAWPDSEKTIGCNLDSFLAEIKQSGVYPEGTVLANCELTGGNDISLVYPWLHISDALLDIKSWLRKDTQKKAGNFPTPPPPLLYGSLGRHGNQDASLLQGNRKLLQGTYSVVERVLPGYDITIAGDQLCVLLGFKTTGMGIEGSCKRSKETKSWREWTGISCLYTKLCQQNNVEVQKAEFLESHKPLSGGVFQYLVLMFLQTTNTRGKVAVLDVVARFRAGNMSGYVTVYSNLSSRIENHL